MHDIVLVPIVMSDTIINDAIVRTNEVFNCLTTTPPILRAWERGVTCRERIIILVILLQ